jgi:hypothetical protein
MKRLTNAWNRFFFEPTPGDTLGVFRCAYGFVVFLNVLGVFPFREIFLGADAIVDAESMRRQFASEWSPLGFSLLPLQEPGMAVFLVALMAASLLLCIGLFSRFASVAVFIGLLSLQNRNPYINNAGDLLMRIDALILLFAPSGAAFSVDARWRGRGQDRIAPWTIRLIQIQLSYLYSSTAVLKLMGPSWRDGTALYYALRYLELRRFDLSWMFYTLIQVKLATWGTLVAELGMGTLIWLKRLRYPLLLAAFGLHFGINLAMQFPIFQHLMMVNLIAFVDPRDLRKWLGPIQQRWDRAEAKILKRE